jgi:soluble lytic murein transglycosylase-like protein
MNSHSSRHFFVSFLLGAAAAAGCAGSSAPVQRIAPAAPAVQTTSSHSNLFVAERTQEATLAKRGSWGVHSDKVLAVMPLVRRSAARHGLPEDLVLAVIWVESRFQPEAVSPVGAQGLMQLMPRTAEYLAEKLAWQGRYRCFDPEFNIEAGTYYVARLLREFEGDLDLALAAYNAGPTKVRRWLASGGLPGVSIEYAAMVRTARRFFGDQEPASFEEPEMLEDTLDRLGLAILIAGLSDEGFGLEREDEAAPLD